MKKYLGLLILLSSAGCSHYDFITKLNEDDRLFSMDYMNPNTNPENIDAIEKSVGSDKSGYIYPEISDARSEFEKKYPGVPWAGDLNKIFNQTYMSRIGQSVAWGIDLENRTSGYLKSSEGKPISITGRFSINSTNIISDQTLSSGVSTTIASSATGFQVAPNTNPAAGGLGVGLIGGFISGAIVNYYVEQSINGLMSSKTYGERMEHSSGTAAHAGHIPQLYPVTPYFIPFDVQPIKVIPGVVRLILIKAGPTNINYTKDLYIASTAGVYRGLKYAKEYPLTEGWEFRVTNLNKITQLENFEDPILRIRAMKKIMIENNI